MTVVEMAQSRVCEELSAAEASGAEAVDGSEPERSLGALNGLLWAILLQAWMVALGYAGWVGIHILYRWMRSHW